MDRRDEMETWVHGALASTSYSHSWVASPSFGQHDEEIELQPMWKLVAAPELRCWAACESTPSPGAPSRKATLGAPTACCATPRSAELRPSDPAPAEAAQGSGRREVIGPKAEKGLTGSALPVHWG
jgi:hypothetical protein